MKKKLMSLDTKWKSRVTNIKSLLTPLFKFGNLWTKILKLTNRYNSMMTLKNIHLLSHFNVKNHFNNGRMFWTMRTTCQIMANLERNQFSFKNSP